MIAFQLWLGHHTGESGVWFRVQSEAWDEGTSFGLTAITADRRGVRPPARLAGQPDHRRSVVAMLVLLCLLCEVPAASGRWSAYIVGVLVLMLLPKTVTARPRFLYTAFPLLIPAPRCLRTRPGGSGGRTSSARAAPAWSASTALYGVLRGHPVNVAALHVEPVGSACAALALLAYVPALVAAPGQMPADTKLYLYLDPGRLISDAPYTWDNRQFAGWVPHQTITYLWPSGPWYWLFEHLGVPDWIAHRLWIGTLLFARRARCALGRPASRARPRRVRSPRRSSTSFAVHPARTSRARR